MVPTLFFVDLIKDVLNTKCTFLPPGGGNKHNFLRIFFLVFTSPLSCLVFTDAYVKFKEISDLFPQTCVVLFHRHDRIYRFHTTDSLHIYLNILSETNAKTKI